MDNSTIDLEVERMLRRTAGTLLTPRRGECLCCYVARMLGEFGCRTTLRFAQRYRDLCAPRATGLERRLGSMGGFCDCEIFLNGMRPAGHLCTFDENGDRSGPKPMPPCAGVRRGSTRPCRNWVRRTRWDE